MKIVSISLYYPPHIGGLEIVAKKTAESLTEAGHTVSVVTCAGATDTRGVEIHEGITVYRMRAWNYFEKKFGIPFPISGVSLFNRLRTEIKYADAVQLHDVFYQISWMTWMLAKWYQKPIVLTQHVGYVAHPSGIVMLFQKMVYKIFGALIFSYATKIISYNPNVTAFLKGEGVSAGKILELRNGIDTDLFAPLGEAKRLQGRSALGLSKPTALFVGRFVPKKGYDLVYAARSHEYDLAFIGSGNFPEEWKQTKEIHFLGPKTQEELAELYPLFDMFVFPAVGEIFTLSMQEAMAAGLPVITTNDPAYESYGFDLSRISLVARTPEALKDAMTAIAKDAALQSDMATYSRTVAEERSNWKKNVSPLLSIYESLPSKETKPVMVTTSWDDGHILDIRLAKLLKQYGVTGTFYIAPRDHEFPASELLTDDDVRALHADFEIGAHTMTHHPLASLSREAANGEIVVSKQYLEEVTGSPITSFCYPRGEYTKDNALDVEDAGYHLARTVSRFSYDLGTNHFELPTSVHTYDHWSDVIGVLKLAKWNPFTFWKLYHAWDRQAIAMFDHVMREGGIFHLWGHSWEVEQHGDWERFENVLRYISGKQHVRYVTNRELLQFGV